MAYVGIAVVKGSGGHDWCIQSKGSIMKLYICHKTTPLKPSVLVERPLEGMSDAESLCFSAPLPCSSIRDWLKSKRLDMGPWVGVDLNGRDRR